MLRRYFLGLRLNLWVIQKTPSPDSRVRGNNVSRFSRDSSDSFANTRILSTRLALISIGTPGGCETVAVR